MGAVNMLTDDLYKSINELIPPSGVARMRDFRLG